GIEWLVVENLLKMCKTPTGNGEIPIKTGSIDAFAAEIVLKAAVLAARKSLSTPKRRGTKHVSRQSSSAGRRKGAPQGARGIQAPGGRKVWRGVLHHQPGWQGRGDLSGGRVAPNRGEAGQTFQLQSLKEISEQGELLRTTGGNGRAGTATASSAPARR